MYFWNVKKRYIKHSLLALGILLFFSAGAYFALYEGYIRLNYPSFYTYPIHGLDISHHQDEIDWNKLDKRYSQFIFIKATEGATHKDSRFEEYRTQARAHNIPVGAYHFFTFCKSGKEQAINFMETVPIDSCDLPPAIDLEFDGNCNKANHKENLLYEITEYIDIIETYYNKRVIIYATSEFYKKYIANNFKDNPIWFRNVYSKPKLENNRQWSFWQYTNRGRISGINSFVDINTWAGTRKGFYDFINSNIQKKE